MHVVVVVVRKRNYCLYISFHSAGGANEPQFPTHSWNEDKLQYNTKLCFLFQSHHCAALSGHLLKARTLRCKESSHNSTALAESPALLFLHTNTMLNNNRLKRGRTDSNKRNKFRVFVFFQTCPLRQVY